MIPVICEIGVNHNGFLASALELVDMAADCGALTVKFQKRTPRLCVPPEEWNRPRLAPWGEEMAYGEYRERMEFDAAGFGRIEERCRRRGLAWTASVWDAGALDFMRQFSVPFVKVPSAKLTDIALLEAVAGAGSPVILSCGMSTDGEVERAVEVLRGVTGASLAHCHSGYPAPDDEQNLSLIPRMREKYGLPVGFSSHAVSPFVPLAAVSRHGAEFVEVHITKDRALPGSDHAASLELPGLRLLMRELHRLDILAGDGERQVWASEEPARKKLRGG